MTIATVAAFAQELGQYGLLERARLDELTRDLLPRFAEPRALARELLQRGWLTPYQVNAVLQGRGAELLLGPYLLQERLGEGGMGQVFKARHRHMGRVVAVKVVRKDRLRDAENVRRFQREIRAASGLSHPNVVAALGADELNGTYFLAMEYVAGTDLAKLVKKQGPLPVARACEYVRQAALGLQHAFEKGMVHRDIKPHNLLLTADGATVKILDMGLARLAHGGEGEDHSATLTQEGSVMGTPDYMAPEQTLDSHSVDVRGDLYSLGCTLYFLLIGRPPFSGGTLGEKIASHLTREPVPVEQLRPEVPLAVGAVMRRLMAKKPEARYQTPAEAAAALTAALTGPMPPVAIVPAEAVSVTLADRPTFVGGDTTLAFPTPAGSAGRKRLLLAGGGAGLVLAVLVLVLLLRRGGSPPTEQPSPKPSPATALFNGKDLTGWEGLPGYWSIKDGALVGSAPQGLKFNTFLCSKKKYGDFELSFEVRLKGGNSGVQIRSEIFKPETFAVRGPQADMGAGFWGSLYGEQFGGMMSPSDPAAVNKILKPDDFNDYSVRCVGKRVTIRLNGLTTVDGDFEKIPADGIIAWQLHAGGPMEVIFRNIRFTDLGIRVVPEPVPPGGDVSPDFAVQGEYDGSLGNARVGAQVVAQGNGTFALRFLGGGLPGSGWDGQTLAQCDGRQEAAGTTFAGASWSGRIEGGRLRGQSREGQLLDMRRVSRESPTLGAKAPPGAIVLFDGSGTQEWKGADQAPPGLLGAGAMSKKAFRDFRLHLEFRLPFEPTRRGQARGNSGVYLQNYYEIQVLDSFGLKGEKNECGAVYGQTAPRLNMCLPPGAWQTYDIDFRAARYGPGGVKTANPVVTVRHNGVLIHDQVEIQGSTHTATTEVDAPGQLHLQRHGSPVVYRNIWVIEPK